MPHWASNSFFYHIYPLGFCGAPEQNDFCSPTNPRLQKLCDWTEHLEGLGVNALYLGPVFESSSHGYDTADYYQVDRRLGDQATLAKVVSAFHQEEIRVVLDGVLNHVGRSFWAFRDVLEHGHQSKYCDWFYGLSFDKQSPYKDPFTYEGWNGHYDLVKLNLNNPDVKNHLLQAVEMWIKEFDIDGLRLDAADCIEIPFLNELAAFCRKIRPEFWLMGEVVHGDYRKWANPQTLDSVTNYECYKGLYSSHVDKNYFEIAYSMERQFGEKGLYRSLPLYNFVDNHDVDRVASKLKNTAHLYPLYCLLFTMPGVPSVYYGSEWGIEGKKYRGSDKALRPFLDLGALRQSNPQPELAKAISRLAKIRKDTPALRLGDYHQLYVSQEQFAFARQTPDECILVVVNAASKPVPLELPVPDGYGERAEDLLNPGDSFQIAGGKVKIDTVPPCWGRILVMR